jgi:ISXO2-like transposase domain
MAVRAIAGAGGCAIRRCPNDKDRPAIIAWVSRQGAVVIQATRDFTVKTVQKAADLAVQAGSRLYTDSASSYRALKGYMHEFVNHTQKEYARGEVHENRAECLFSLLKPYLRVFRGRGTWASFSSCATVVSRMRASRPNCSCRQPETQPLPAEPEGENLSNAWTILIFYKLR